MTKNKDLNLQNDSLPSSETHRVEIWWLVIIGLSAATAALIFYFYTFEGSLSHDVSDWGVFGDYLGGVLNPIFSFLSLIALLITIRLQAQELRISTAELKKSAEALHNQNQTLVRQNFESSFFQLLKLHNDIVANMEIHDQKGRACFRFLKNEVSRPFFSQTEAPKNMADFESLYRRFNSEYENAIGHYFRMLYNIIKLVKNTEGIEKQFYINLVRAQLSGSESEMIFYNCASSFGNAKFKPLVEEFALLKTMPAPKRGNLPPIVMTQVLISEYSPNAFGDRYHAIKSAAD